MSTFKITTVGANAAGGQANPQGLAVEITHFRIGSSFGYDPTPDQTELRGTILHFGLVSAIRQHSPTTKAVIFEIPVTAGPWDFGEIGLYLKTGELYAVMAYQRPMRKLSVLVDGIPHAPVFHCLLKMAPGNDSTFAVVDGPSGSNLLEVASFSYVTAPLWMPNLPNVVIVHEGDTLPAVLLYRNSDYTWVPAGFDYLGSFDGSMPTTGSVYSSFLNNYTSSVYGDVLIQDQWGRIRYTAYIASGTAVLSAPFPITPQHVSTKFTLYKKSASLFTGGDTSEDDSGFLTSSEAREIWQSTNRYLGGGNELAATRGAYGLNLATLPLPTGDAPTDAEWEAITDAANKIRAHIQSPVDGNPLHRLVAPKRSNPLMYGARVESLRRTTGDILPYSRRPDGVYEEVANIGYNRSLTNHMDWISSRITVDYSWVTLTAANVFFNAGGYLDFRMRCNRGTFVGWVLWRMISLLGSVRFWAEGVETTGPMRLTFDTGDGAMFPKAHLGWHGVDNNSFRHMFSYAVPAVALERFGNDVMGVGGSSQTDEHLIVSMHAKGTATGVQLRFSLNYTGIDNLGYDQEGLTLRNESFTNFDDPDLNAVSGNRLTSNAVQVFALSGRRRASGLITPAWPVATVVTADTLWGTPMGSSETFWAQSLAETSQRRWGITRR